MSLHLGKHHFKMSSPEASTIVTDLPLCYTIHKSYDVHGRSHSPPNIYSSIFSVCARVQACMYVCMCAHVTVYVHVCTGVYVHTHVYTY